MILQNSLYHVIDKTSDGMEQRYTIRLDATHFIYQAHFPGQPVTPGVCVIQIAKELLEDCLDVTVDLQKVNNVKFLSVLSPVDNEEVEYDFSSVSFDTEDNTIKTKVLVRAGDTVCAKLSFVCKKKM